MIKRIGKTISNNRVTTAWGTAIVIAETLRFNPEWLGFLPDNIKGYILGIASIVCGLGAAISVADARNRPEKPTKLKKENEEI